MEIGPRRAALQGAGSPHRPRSLLETWIRKERVMSNPSDTSISLEDRIRRIEDHLAIYQLVVAYGPAVDAVDYDQIFELWTEDCVYDLEGIGVYRGHEGFRAMLDEPDSPSPKLLDGGSAHVLSLPYIVIEGDEAVATNYGRIYTRKGEGFVAVRVVASRWHLVRTPKGWRIKHRVNRIANGSEAARSLLAAFSRGPSESKLRGAEFS
jgi:hypothetical protein